MRRIDLRLAFPAAVLTTVLAAAVLAVTGFAPVVFAPARAQTPAAVVIQPNVAAAAAAVAKGQDGLRAVSASAGGGADDAQLVAAIAALPPIQAQLAGALATLTPVLQAADARLAQLGPAPGPGQPPEAAQVADNRRSLTRFRQGVDGEVKQAKLLSVEASQLATALAGRRRALFSSRLWAQGRSILAPALWRDFARALPRDVRRLQAVLGEEGDQAAAAARQPGARAAWVLALVAGLCLLGPGRALLNRLGYSYAARVPPGLRLGRSGLAVWLVLVAGLTPLLCGAAVRAAVLGTDAATPAFDQLVVILIRVAVFAGVFEGLGRALLSPGKPAWRLAPIRDGMVTRVAAFPGLIGATAGLAALVAQTNAALGTSLAASEAGDCLSLLLVLAAVSGALIAAGRARSEQLAASAEAASPYQGGGRLPWVLAAWLAVAGALVAVVCGYLALASFITREMIWIAMVLGTMFLLLRFVDDLFPALLSPDHAVGRFIETALSLSAGAMEPVGVLLAGLFRVLVLLFGWAAILLRSGTSAGDVMGRLSAANLVFHLGQVSVSPVAIAGAAAVLLLGLGATRAVKRWLEVSYLPKTRMDVGVQTSLTAALGYCGFLLAALLALGYLGLSLDKIALVASALSVGIGFGLQAVIGNFVSGLILLAERPVKVGDWIAIGDLEGDVRRINVRATEIEMQDRSKLIVPNSDLISKVVRNVTFGSPLGRVRIVLLADNAADPAAVRELISARLAGHPEVLKEPAPGVYLSAVRDGGLEFTAFAYVASPRDVFRIRSELLFQIVPDLKTRGIALATLRPVVNVAAPDRPAEPSIPRG